MNDYYRLLDAVEKYYGSGSDEWREISLYGITSDRAESILKQVPGVNIVKNANGKIRSYNFAPTENITPEVEQAVNSNVPEVIKSFEVPADTGIETVTSETGEAVKQMTFKSGMKQAGSFVFGEIAPALAATATGITLGKTVDSLLYNANPDFWEEHGMSTLDPDTWGEIIGTDTANERILNTILGTTPDGKTQAYIDENALAYMALYMQNKGVFGTKEFSPTENLQTGDITINGFESRESVIERFLQNASNDAKNIININYARILAQFSEYPDYQQIEIWYDSPLLRVFISETNYPISAHYDHSKESYTFKANRVKQWYNTNINYKDRTTGIESITGYQSGYHGAQIFSRIGTYTESNIDGIGTQEGATLPDLSGANTPEEALQKLKEQYPDLWDKAVSQDVVQPDGSVETYTYVPVAMPDIDEYGNPITSTSTQSDPQVQPETATKTLLDLITKIIQRNPPTNPPDRGDGDTPPVVPPSGSASSLYAIYNPTLSQINAFGAWLWSDDFVDQIKKLFNDPMQAIIGLHKVYATPATGGSQNIKVGYLDSGVSAKVVSNQYTTIDCGTVRLSEQYHNVFDYSPYTEVNLYLPFIGIVNINVSDVMRSSIHIVYHVDVLSGACLAEVKVTRDSAGGTLYQYAGNASVTLPISSGSYMGIVSAVAGVAGGIAGTIASGGSALPLIASSAGAMFNAHTRVEHSGGFSGNAGAMGGKIPYLIISRPQTEMADGFENYIGYPSNFTTTIGSCNGFVKVLECHLENINATKSELEEIYSILKEGVIT